MSPAPQSTLRIIDKSSRKKRKIIFSPGKFFIGIVFAASLLLALSVYLTAQLDGQSSATSRAASSSSNAKGEAAAVTSDGDDNVRPVICNELLKDPTIWDPSKLHNTLFSFSVISPMHLSYKILQRNSLNTKINVPTKMR